MDSIATCSCGIYGLGAMHDAISGPEKRAGRAADGASYGDMLASLEANKSSEVDAAKSTSDMTMEEFRDYIWRRIDSFPFSPTRPYDEQTIKISDRCWERMKSDPEYEEKMMSIIRDGRMYPDPFFGTGMDTGGVYWVLEFDGGEGCWSHGFGKNFGGSAASAKAQFGRESEGGFWSTRTQKRKQQSKIDELIFARRKMANEINEKIAFSRHMNLKAAAMGEKTEYMITGIPADFLLMGLGI